MNLLPPPSGSKPQKTFLATKEKKTMVRSMRLLLAIGAMGWLVLDQMPCIGQAGDPGMATPYGLWGRGPAGGWVFPPSYFGYNLDDNIGGYYGGGRYREYYSYGRGYGIANYPGPLPGPGVPPDYRGLRHVPWYLEAPDIASYPAAVIVPKRADHSVVLVVEVPQDAEIWIDSRQTQQTGIERTYESPPLAAGKIYTYEIRAKWQENGRANEQSQIVMALAGEKVSVHFPAPIKAEKHPQERVSRKEDKISAVGEEPIKDENP